MKKIYYLVVFMLCVFIFNNNNISFADSTYFYDQNGRLTQQRNDAGETTKYEYDNAGNLLTKFYGEPFFQVGPVFDSQQGKDNWYYQIWNGSSFEDMTWDTENSRWKGTSNWDLITKEWMHPDMNDVALKWVAPQSGTKNYRKCVQASDKLGW